MSNKKRNSEDDKLDAFHNELKKKIEAKVLATKTPSVSTASDEADEMVTVNQQGTAASKKSINPVRKSRGNSEFDKNHMRHRVKDDSSESSDEESFATNYQYSYSSGYGMVPMQSMAFTSPYVDSFDKPRKSFIESSGDSSSEECFDGYDNVEDGVEFFYKPKSTGRTEFTVTVEPKKQPWLPMMKCGFKPMVNCMAPPAYLIPPNCSNAPEPLHTRFQCIPPQCNDYVTYQNPCCNMPYCGNNCCTNPQSGNMGNYYNNQIPHSHGSNSSNHTSHNSSQMRGRTAVVSKIEDVSHKSQSSRNSGDSGDSNSKSGPQMAHSNFASLANTTKS